jgi:hypothetical protein
MVTDREMDLIRCAPQSYFCMVGATMFGRIAQRLLQHPVETKTNAGWQGRWKISERYVNPMATRRVGWSLAG